jgi:crotonobetaine/carnitine-CoA ligase
MDGMLVTDLLDPSAPGGDHCRVIFGDRVHTRATLRQAARVQATELWQSGVQAGDRVAVLSAGRMEVVVAIFAVAYVGGINVVLNSFLKGEMLVHQLNLTTPRLVIVDDAGAAALAAVTDKLAHRPVIVSIDAPGRSMPVPAGGAVAAAPQVEQSPSDPVSIVFTSGTTGRSKGCVLSNRYVVESGRRMAQEFPLGIDDLYYTPYPLFHIGGQCAGLSYALGAGASVAFDAEFHASTFWDRVRDLGATYAQGTGAIGMALLAQPPSPRDKDNPLRRASWIPMGADAQRAFAERFDVRVVSEWYGQTEMSPICMNTAWTEGGCTGSMGFPLPDVEVRIVNGEDEVASPGIAGELIVRPRRAGIMFSGYWAQPERTVEAWRDLWYRTGDVVVEEPDGSLTFIDRKSDSVRRSGENVSCFEVEQVLLRLPGVAKAAVHAIPAELIEDEIKAWIVLEDGAELGLREVFDHCATRLPYFAIPCFVEFAAELPVNAMGKVLKDALRAAGPTSSQHDLKALGLVLDRTGRR